MILRQPHQPNLARVVARAVLIAAALLGWYYFLGLALNSIRGGIGTPAVPIFWLYDWHVHYAGAAALMNHSLYHGPIEVPGWPLPVGVFNLPPAAALIAVPFALLGRELGGVVWLLVGLGSLIAAGWLATWLVGLRHRFAILGIAFGVYALAWPFFIVNVTLGNVNNLMLLVIVGFAFAYLRGHSRWAGLLLGTAIAIKLWPAALVVLLIRERQLTALRWTAAALAVQGLFLIGWLGPRVVPDLVTALSTKVPLEPGVIIMWTTWARETLGWWPWWAAPALAITLLAVPARGKAGMGLGILGGLSLIPNVWDHYLGAFLFAGLLIGCSVVENDDRIRRFISARLRISSRRPTAA